MISRAKYYEKRLHKLNKRLNKMKNKPGSYTNYNKLYENVVNKINSYNKTLKGRE